MAIKFETFRGTASGVTGGLVYKGSYNAATSTPSLVTASKGDFYIVSVAGTLAGVTLNVGDHIVFNQDAANPVTSAMFDVIDNTDAVASVNGQTGVVVLDSDDVSEGSTNLYFTNTRADGRIAAADLTDLNDVNYTAGAPIDGYVLKYVNANSRWEALAETGGSPTLQDVTDNGSTTTTNISTAQITLGGDLLADGDQTRTIGSETNRFITAHGDLNGAVRFKAKASVALSKGEVVYIDGVSGGVPTVSKAQANNASTMPAFGFAYANASLNAEVQIVTFGNLEGINTGTCAVGDTLFVSETTAGATTKTAPTGESNFIQNIGKVVKVDAVGNSGIYKVGGAGRTNATPNLDTDKIFLGNASNQAVSTALSSVNLSSFNKDLDTDDVSEGATNLYYTNARFDTQLGTKTTDNLTEGSTNLYFTNTRADGRIAAATANDLSDVSYTAGVGIDGYVLEYVHANNQWEAKVPASAPVTSVNTQTGAVVLDTDDVSEGSTNLYYTNARFDTQLGTKTTDNLTEGSTNLYFTNARADGRIAAATANDLSDVSYTAGAGIDGQFLKYVHANNQWEASTVSTGGFTYSSIATGDSPVTGALDTHYSADTSGGAITVNLPAIAAGNAGQEIRFKLKTAGNNLSITPNGTDQVEGGGAGVAYTLSVQNQSITLVSDGSSNWEII